MFSCLFNLCKRPIINNELSVADIEITVPQTPPISEIDTDSIKYFDWSDQTFEAKPCNIYDGDTFSACWYYKGDIIKYRCRCLGYDSPEMKVSKTNEKRDEIKASAVIAKNKFIELLTQDDTIIIVCDKFDKYGRVLVKVYNKHNGPRSLNDIMINEGYGYVYNGGTKRT